VEAHKLSEVNEYIKQVIALNFEDSIWVKAEIAQVKSSGKHVYLELIEKDEQDKDVVARVSAVIWFQAHLFIKNKLGDLISEILTDGTQIQCKVKIDFHPKYGLKFIIQDIDASYTFGQLELERQKTIEKLRKEALIGKNKETKLPSVIQRIAVISSEKAAGLQDFLKQLDHNPYHYDFDLKIYQASVQGKQLEKEILSRLEEIEKLGTIFDCVAIIRGGGSKLDLSGFDSFALSRKVALFPLPVITGIGHDIDHNVIEMVTHSPVKTPSAAANFIIDRNLHFESEFVETHQYIKQASTRQLIAKKGNLDQLFSMIKLQAIQKQEDHRKMLTHLMQIIYQSARSALRSREYSIKSLGQELALRNPLEVLNRGYTLVYKEGKRVSAGEKIAMGEKVDLLFKDGKMEVENKGFTLKKSK
jgi:exodeoxyribonuclease VII large subunit